MLSTSGLWTPHRYLLTLRAASCFSPSWLPPQLPV